MMSHRFRLADNDAHKLALAAILLIAFAIRVNGIGFGLPYQLHPDEPPLLIAAKSLNEPSGLENLIRNRILYEIARSYPPLYPRFLMWEHRILTALLSSNVPQPLLFLVARVSSAVMGLIAISAVFLISNSLRDQLTGLIAAAFLAVNPTFVEHSRYATADMLMTSLALLALSCAFWALRSRRRLAGYASLTLSLLAFTAKYNALPVLFAAIYSILRASYSKSKAQFVADISLVLVSISGVFPLLHSRYHMFDITSVPGSPTGSILERRTFFELPSAGANWHALLSALDGSLYLIIVVTGLSVMLWNRTSRREVNPEAVGLALAFIVSFFTMMSLFIFHGIRDFLPVIGVAAAIWALSIRLIFSSLQQYSKFSRGEQAAALGLAALLLIPFTLQTISHGFHISQKDTRAITADWFEENVPNGAKIVAEYDAVEFMADYGGYPGTKRFSIDVVDSLLKSPVDEYRREGVRYLIADSRSGELGRYFSDSDNEEFVNNVTVVKTISNEGRPGPARIIFHPWPPIQHPMPVNLGDQVTLLGYNIDKRTVRAGDILHLILYWQAQRPLDASYTVFTHLVDQEGLIWGQKDQLPLNGVLPTNSWPENEVIADDYLIAVKEGTPPGEYQLLVGMYLLETMERLSVLDKDAHRADNAIALTHVQVIP